MALLFLRHGPDNTRSSRGRPMTKADDGVASCTVRPGESRGPAARDRARELFPSSSSADFLGPGSRLSPGRTERGARAPAMTADGSSVPSPPQRGKKQGEGQRDNSAASSARRRAAAPGAALRASGSGQDRSPDRAARSDGKCGAVCVANIDPGLRVRAIGATKHQPAILEKSATARVVSRISFEEFQPVVAQVRHVGVDRHLVEERIDERDAASRSRASPARNPRARLPRWLPCARARWRSRARAPPWCCRACGSGWPL